MLETCMSPLEKTETETDWNGHLQGAEGIRPVFLSLNLLTIYGLTLTLEDNCRHLFQITFWRINNTIHSYNTRSANKTKYKLRMKDLIIDVSQLDIAVLWYGTVCQIVWRTLSHLQLFKRKLKCFVQQKYIDSTWWNIYKVYYCCCLIICKATIFNSSLWCTH